MIQSTIMEWLEKLPVFYANNLRYGMFTSLLTLTGILFAVQNFLVTGLYQNVYSKKRYRDEARKAEPHKHPLSRLELLARRMRYCTTVCLVASLTQFSVGFFEHFVATIACLAAGLYALWTFIRMYLTQRDVIDSWLEYLKWETDQDDV